MFKTDWLNDSELETVNRFATRKRQMEWMSGRFAVKKLATRRVQCSKNKVVVRTDENGAPSLSGFPQYNISISHSHELAVAGISPSDIRIGLDVENADAIDTDLIRKVGFSKREREALKNRPGKEVVENWTKKEAWLKLIGKGFNENLQEVEVMDGAIIYQQKRMEELSIQTETIGNRYVFTLLYKRNTIECYGVKTGSIYV